MPLFVALDECNCAMTDIERYAELALYCPETRDALLILILLRCGEADATIGGLM